MPTKKPAPKKAPPKRAAVVARPVAALAEVSDSSSHSSSHSSSSYAETPIVNASMEEIINGLVQVRSALSSSLSELAAKQTAEASRLGELRSGIDTTVRQIRELHNLEVKDDSLSSLVAQHQQAADAHQKTLAEKRETFDRELTDLRRAWDKEKEDRARTVAEDNETYAKAAERDKQEYTYGLQQRRELDKDAYEHQKKQRESELADFQKSQQKAWDDREKIIADLEKHHADTKAKVDEFPAKLDAALKKAREEGRGIAAAQAKVKADLIEKEIEADKRLFDLRVKGYEDSIKEHTARIAQLTQKLAEAVAQAQGLAIKSIEGASNVSSFAAVKEIALEQAKNTQKKS